MGLRVGAHWTGQGCLALVAGVIHRDGAGMRLGRMSVAQTPGTHGQGPVLMKGSCAILGGGREVSVGAGARSNHARSVQAAQADIAGLAGHDARHAAVLRERTWEGQSCRASTQPERRSLRRLNLLHRKDRACSSWRQAFHALLDDRQLPWLPPGPFDASGIRACWLGFAGPSAWSLALRRLSLHRSACEAIQMLGTVKRLNSMPLTLLQICAAAASSMLSLMPKFQQCWSFGFCP